MALLRKGSRPIVVDGQPYRWRIRRQPTYSQECLESIFLFAVEHAHANGAKLVVDLPGVRLGDCYGEPIKKPVQPSDVAQAIRAAIAAGWKPSQVGKPFEMRTENMAFGSW